MGGCHEAEKREFGCIKMIVFPPAESKINNMKNEVDSFSWLFLFIERRAIRQAFFALTFAGILSIANRATGEPVWNAFAGRETLVVGGINERLPPGERVWFRVAKERRTVASGTVGGVSNGRVEVPIRLPEMKPGVALPFEVELRAGSEQGRVLRNGTMWAFSEQPFDPARRLTAPRTLLLYDPDGHTAAALRSIGLSCDTLERPALLEGVTNAVIVVGEGLSLESERGLADLLDSAVTRGNRVLMLAPHDGQFKPPATWRVLLAGNVEEVLRKPAAVPAPYKLDLSGWPPDGRAAQVRFRLAAERDAAVFTVTPEAGCEAVGWDDAASGGRFRACGLGIVAKWNETPAARWLLVELVEGLAKEE